jgi:hypothetical protein
MLFGERTYFFRDHSDRELEAARDHGGKVAAYHDPREVLPGSWVSLDAKQGRFVADFADAAN